jgi:hypothetical protein
LAAAASEPRIQRMTGPPEKVGRFLPVEIALDIAAQYKNPYNPDDIAVSARFVGPQGTPVTVVGFLYQDFDRALDDGKEKLAPSGPRQWKVRYAPIEEGRHEVTVEVRTRDGTARSEPRTFLCVPSDSPGYIGRSRGNPGYFEFSAGRPFFPIGHNVCWADSQLKTFDYDQQFRRMAANKENFTRIWMCSWSLELEGQRLDDYRLDNAWRLDHILRFARKYGIYVKLCFDNFYDFTQRRGGPYWRANGGMCAQPRDFFLDETARRHYRRRLRYIVARWGHCTQLMAWEFWNEMDYAPSAKGKVRSRKEPYMLSWTSEMATELRRLDPAGHLVTNTLAAYTDWPEFWALPDLDFVQVHAYIYEDWEPTPHQYDAAALVLDLAQEFGQHRKPYLVGELGFHAGDGTHKLNQLDPLGIHLHNALWASSLGGAAGAPMLWWWDNYVEPNDLYYHYRALGRFLDGMDWTGKPWVRVRDSGETDLRIVGMRTDDEGMLWFHDRRNTWHRRMVKKEPVKLISPFVLRLPGFRPGRYEVEWFDTYGGIPITVANATADGRGLELRLSHLVRAPDVACRVRKRRR